MKARVIFALIIILTLLVASTSATGFVIGAAIGAKAKADELENACLYTNRLELTKGWVLECRYLEGVTLK